MRESRARPTGEESAHDILAAEAFAMPAPEPRPHPELMLPSDPAGIPEPHDILAAEEFAMPAPELGHATQGAREGPRPSRSRLMRLAGAGVVGVWLRGRRRR